MKAALIHLIGGAVRIVDTEDEDAPLVHLELYNDFKYLSSERLRENMLRAAMEKFNTDLDRPFRVRENSFEETSIEAAVQEVLEVYNKNYFDRVCNAIYCNQTVLDIWAAKIYPKHRDDLLPLPKPSSYVSTMGELDVIVDGELQAREWRLGKREVSKPKATEEGA